MIVYDSTVSERYAKALFNVAKRQDIVETVRADAEQLLLAHKNSKLTIFLEGPQFSTEDKLNLVKKVFTERTAPVVVQLLIILLKKGRIQYTRPIFTRYIELAEADQGLRQAEIATASELADSDKQRVKQALEGYTKSRLNLRYIIDPTLIAGIRFTMGDLMIDDSVKGKLDRLRFQLQSAAKA